MGIWDLTLIIFGIPFCLVKVGLCIKRTFEGADASRRGHIRDLTFFSIFTGFWLVLAGGLAWRMLDNPYILIYRLFYFLVLLINILQAINIFKWGMGFLTFVFLFDLLMVAAYWSFDGLSNSLMFFICC